MHLNVYLSADRKPLLALVH